MSGCKAWENLNAKGFGLLCHPPGDIGEAHDIISMIFKAVGQHPLRKGNGLGRGQQHETVFRHRR